MKKILITLIILSLSLNSYSQSLKKIKALNKYVNFTNESVHGLLIIHRLLENYNQEINKFVDLPNYKINNINNSDLPSNIFEDKEHWFYETTPYELFKKIKSSKTVIGKNNFNILFPIARNMYKTENKINAIRFKISDFISKRDLNNKEELKKIYSMLEDAVDLYDLFYAYELNLISALNAMYPNQGRSPYIELYQKSIDLLLSVRAKDYENFEHKIYSLTNQLKKIKAKNNHSIIISKRIIPLLEDISGIARQLNNHPEVPEEYLLYGKDYYYYNIKLIEKYNRYGNGFIFFLNNYLHKNKIKALNRFEYPHYYKVIYPRKISKKIETIKSKIKNITSIPLTLNGRKVEYCDQRIINVDSSYLEILLYDNKIQDGDIVSVNFNGNWFLKNLSLETKPKKVILKLNKEGKNYIILHAENVGRMPPNTIGIKYKYHGQNKTVLMESDLNNSELLEFKIDDNKQLSR